MTDPEHIRALQDLELLRSLVRWAEAIIEVEGALGEAKRELAERSAQLDKDRAEYNALLTELRRRDWGRPK